VEDNGVGFAGIRSRENGAKGSGLFIMEERARLLEGRIEIASQPNEGTRIIITFPDSKR
jgi:signal transduction histidine kinase